jgi:predicted ATPase
MALLFASMLPRWLNQHSQTLALSAEAMALTREHGMSHWMETSAFLQGWAETMQEGRQGLSELMSLSTRLSVTAPAYAALRWAGVAEAHMRLKQYDVALGLLAQAQASESISGSAHFAAERHRLTGVCLLALSPPDAQAAEARFDEALAISRGQGAKVLELRATLSLARLWYLQGKTDPARHLLASICAWFTEGFDIPDLVEAADQLRAWA